MPSSDGRCSPLRWPRRRVLQWGALPWLGLGLPELLQPAAAEAPDKAPAKSCIFIFQYGGLSQLDSWDPKPHAPAELRGPYAPIATRVPGLFVGELMPELAQRADRYAVIRSMSHSVPVHDVANRMLLAGRSLPQSDAPSFGAMLSRLRPSEGSVPSHVWLQKFGGGAMPPEPAYTTGGFLGMAHAPLVLGHTADDHPAAEGYRVAAFDAAEGVSPQRMAGRRSLLSALDDIPESLRESPRLRDCNRSRERAFDLLTGPRAQRAGRIDEEPDAVRDRYGRNPLGQNLLLARRFVEAGVRLVSVVAWCGKLPSEPFLSIETWDMHGNAGIGIFDNGWNGLGYALPRCDQAVAALLDDLQTRGMLDSTLVVLVGEFGRTPKISRGAGAIGRDHWPWCYSAMLAGGGVRGGQVYGGSDAQAAYVRSQPVSPEDFAATLLQAMGIDPASRLGRDGFTYPASPGQPVLALF